MSVFYSNPPVCRCSHMLVWSLAAWRQCKPKWPCFGFCHGWFVHCVYYANQFCLKFRWFRRLGRDALAAGSSGRFSLQLIWPETVARRLSLGLCLLHQLPAELVFVTPALKHRAEYLSAALYCPALIVISLDKGKLCVTRPWSSTSPVFTSTCWEGSSRSDRL